MTTRVKHFLALGALASVISPGLSMRAPDVYAAQALRKPASVEALAAQLVQAIHRNDLQLALGLLPTREELQKAGLTTHATEKRHARLLARAKRDFAKVMAKFTRRNPGGCKRLVFARVKLGELRRKGGLSLYDSIDVFAKCDGREIWVADPDGVFRAAGGWRLLEIS